jgi:hypothetical protein
MLKIPTRYEKRIPQAKYSHFLAKLLLLCCYIWRQMVYVAEVSTSGDI